MTETDRPLAPLITMTESERALAESKGESAAFRAELGLMSNTERNVVVLLRRSLAELDAQRAARATAEAELQTIDNILARRPALDQPTRWQNVEKAINAARAGDEAQRQLAALRRQEKTDARVDA